MKKAFECLAILLIFFYISTQKCYGITETNFNVIYESEVKPFFEKNSTQGSFAGVDQVPIVYRYFPAPDEKGALIVLPGMGQSILQYAELVYDLRNEGLSVYLFEHRGHGLSGRMVRDTQVVHVKNFQDYVDDLAYFMKNIVSLKPHPKVFLLAHSMGGGIGAMYLEQNPGAFDAAILTAPMFQINTAPYLNSIAHGIASLACLFGFGENYVTGQGPYVAGAPFSKNKLTHSEVRFARTEQNIVENPAIMTGGVSYSWLKTSIEADEWVFGSRKNFTSPTLLLQAENERIVMNPAEDRFCQTVTSCKEVILTNSFHNLLLEKDSIRDQAIFEIHTFLKTYE